MIDRQPDLPAPDPDEEVAAHRSSCHAAFIRSSRSVTMAATRDTGST
jgi:hypothetical protein